MSKKPDLPLRGHTEGRVATPHVDRLTDEELDHLNRLLPWNCFTVDAHRRRFGDLAWAGKRAVPQIVPDPRIVQMHEAFTLTGKHVLEIGCFEGVHTVGLCQFAGKVTAVDARVENLVKTVVRTAMFDCRPSILQCDVENPDDLARLPSVDLVHHVGVLYHLTDPVRHLRLLAPKVCEGMLLDTHVATDAAADASFTTDGKTYRCKLHREGGKAEVFSGMYDHAKWLLLDDLVAVLRECGFPRVEVIEVRDERNGPRARLHAFRES